MFNHLTKKTTTPKSLLKGDKGSKENPKENRRGGLNVNVLKTFEDRVVGGPTSDILDLNTLQHKFESFCKN